MNWLDPALFVAACIALCKAIAWLNRTPPIEGPR